MLELTSIKIMQFVLCTLLQFKHLMQSSNTPSQMIGRCVIYVEVAIKNLVLCRCPKGTSDLHIHQHGHKILCAPKSISRTLWQYSHYFITMPLKCHYFITMPLKCKLHLIPTNHNSCKILISKDTQCMIYFEVIVCLFKQVGGKQENCISTLKITRKHRTVELVQCPNNVSQ